MRVCVHSLRALAPVLQCTLCLSLSRSITLYTQVTTHAHKPMRPRTRREAAGARACAQREFLSLSHSRRVRPSVCLPVLCSLVQASRSSERAEAAAASESRFAVRSGTLFVGVRGGRGSGSCACQCVRVPRGGQCVVSLSRDRNAPPLLHCSVSPLAIELPRSVRFVIPRGPPVTVPSAVSGSKWRLIRRANDASPLPAPVTPSVRKFASDSRHSAIARYRPDRFSRSRGTQRESRG